MGNARPPKRRRVQGVEGFHIPIQLCGMKDNMPVKFFDVRRHPPERGIPVSHEIPAGFGEQ
jgi:hypothetical protein